nr:E3 ubiquitin-protein ligase RNF144A [Ipomoea batatas]GMD33690.1 E3 ubiquitin-protein ligase RNF144A [Ipomoea batatas]GMD37138.1 E3 ubiquitin-protein ligase RNF144A [Ipomoea batatas]
MPSALNYFSAKTQTPRRHAGELCEICMDTKTQNQMFRSDSCTHSYCSDCIGRHIAAKIQENCVSSGGVKCPAVSCKGIIEPRHCGSINIRREVLDRWEIAVCESLILASQKFYCPYKDCSAMMVDDGSEMITASECPNCRRLFCAQCKVAWHAEKDCREFQSLDIEDERGREEDEMLMELAEKKQWRRCPRCSFYVERRDGCLHISCRCGKEFCYRCGATYSPLHVCPSTYDQD